MRPRWVWLGVLPAVVTAASTYLTWRGAHHAPDNAADLDVGVMWFLAILSWIRAVVCGVAYMAVMRLCTAVMHRFRVYRHAYLMLCSVGLLAGLGGLHSARGALYCAGAGVLLGVVFILAHRPQIAPPPFSLSNWARGVRRNVATRPVRLLTGFLLPLILGALLFALCDGWRDGTWFEQWGRCLPLVSVVMALPTLLYTITMEIAATSMQRRGIDNRPVLIALSTFLGLLAGGLLGVMALIGMPVGLVCGFVLMRLR
jgi:hypothetical protein